MNICTQREELVWQSPLPFLNQFFSFHNTLISRSREYQPVKLFVYRLYFKYFFLAGQEYRHALLDRMYYRQESKTQREEA